MAETSISLPDWATELVQQGRDEGNLVPLVEALSQPHSNTLEAAQLQYLYELAEPALVRQVIRLRHHLHTGRIEVANRLYNCIDAARSRGKLDLQQHLVNTAEIEWDMVRYMRRVQILKEAYEAAKEQDEQQGKQLLADNLRRSEPIEAWEYGGEPETVLELARDTLLNCAEHLIAQCHTGNLIFAEEILEIVKQGKLNWETLSVTKHEVEAWERRALIGSINWCLYYNGNSDAGELLYESIRAPLELMLEHDITPEEARIPRDRLKEIKYIMQAWLPKEIASVCEVYPQEYRQALDEFRTNVLPLFDQVLQQD
ncbi:MAG TPA: hypothetical protein VFZ58_04970 [Candidatus Saccharimonadales bacterium]